MLELSVHPFATPSFPATSPARRAPEAHPHDPVVPLAAAESTVYWSAIVAGYERFAPKGLEHRMERQSLLQDMVIQAVRATLRNLESQLEGLEARLGAIEIRLTALEGKCLPRRPGTRNRR